MMREGQTGSRAEVKSYLKSVLGDLYDSEKTEVYLDSAAGMIRDLEGAGVKFQTYMSPDYYPGRPGWKFGRTLVACDFNGRGWEVGSNCSGPH
jgi:hypothetical protein